MEHPAAPRHQGGAARRFMPGQTSPSDRPRDAAAAPGGVSRAPAGPSPAPGGDEQVRGAHPDAEAAVFPAVPRRLPERRSVRNQVLSALRRALMAGEFEPGEVYSAPVLAERFGVSATPVREAMQLLASEGVVEAMPNRGFRIAERSARDLAELAEVRALLELPVLLRLARTVPAERWQPLWPLVDAGLAAAAAGDRCAYAEADRSFHHAMLELSGNRQLAALSVELHNRAQWPPTDFGATSTVPSRTHPTRTADRLVHDANEHALLLEALTAADTTTAEAVLRGHYGVPIT